MQLRIRGLRRAIGAVATAGPGYALSQCIPSTRVKIADQKGVKRPLEASIAEGDKITAAVTDADLDSILPDEGYETLPPPKNDAQPEG